MQHVSISFLSNEISCFAFFMYSNYVISSYKYYNLFSFSKVVHLHPVMFVLGLLYVIPFKHNGRLKWQNACHIIFSFRFCFVYNFYVKGQRFFLKIHIKLFKLKTRQEHIVSHKIEDYYKLPKQIYATCDNHMFIFNTIQHL